MRLSKYSILFAVIIAAAFFVVGIYTYPLFFRWTLPRVNGTYYNAYSAHETFSRNLYYSMAWGLLPLLTLFIWTRNRLQTPAKRLLAVSIMVVTAILFVVYRRQWILGQLHTPDAATGLDPDPMRRVIAMGALQLELYLLLGVMAGAFLSFVMLRPKNR